MASLQEAPMAKIRPVDVSIDVQSITKIYNHYVTNTVVTFDTSPLDTDQMRTRIEAISSKFPYLVATIDTIDGTELVIGYAYANTFRSRSAYDWTVETSIVFDPKYTGHGYGTELYQELMNRLKAQGFVVAVAAITYPLNEKSVKFHKKLGWSIFGKLKKCGFKFNQWHDVWFLEYRLNEPTVPPTDLW